MAMATVIEMGGVAETNSPTIPAARPSLEGPVAGVDGPAVLVWQDVVVKAATGSKRLLNGVSGSIGGGFWAVMGCVGRRRAGARQLVVVRKHARRAVLVANACTAVPPAPFALDCSRWGAWARRQRETEQTTHAFPFAYCPLSLLPLPAP